MGRSNLLAGVAFRPVLAAMTFIMLPLLPDRTIDPWDTINPFENVVSDGADRRDLLRGLHAVKAVGDETGIVMTGVAVASLHRPLSP